MKVSFNEVLKRALITYGLDSQVISSAEECAELTAALLQSHRGRFPLTDDKVTEEIADVELMMAQLRMLPGIQERVEHFMGLKIERLHERLERGD